LEAGITTVVAVEAEEGEAVAVVEAGAMSPATAASRLTVVRKAVATTF
jgi:predicted DNA-binding protein (UPF0251 family)